MKEAACHSGEVVTDTTSNIGKGIKKSIKKTTKGAKLFARELVPVEDAAKMLQKMTHPEEYKRRKSGTSVVHTTIDWAKYPPCSYRKFVQQLASESEDEVNEEGERSMVAVGEERVQCETTRTDGYASNDDDGKTRIFSRSCSCGKRQCHFRGQRGFNKTIGE